LLSVLLAACLPAAAPAGEPAACWSFDHGLDGSAGATEIGPTAGSGTLAPGRTGAGAAPGEDGLTYRLPSTLAQRGALAFWYRAPPPEAKRNPDLAILRVGAATLTARSGRKRFYWDLPGESPQQSAENTRTVNYYFDGLHEWELIEVEWGRTAPVRKDGASVPANRVYVRGAQACVSARPDAPTAGPLQFTLLAGVFDDVRATADMTLTGMRYDGVILSEKFEAPALPGAWRAYRPGRQPVERVPGALGSAGALTRREPLPKDGAIYVSVPNVLFTDDTLVCALVRSTTEAQCVVSIATPQNHPARPVRLPANTWTSVRASLRTFLHPYQIDRNDTIVQVTFLNPSPKAAAFAIDNFAVIRGRNKSRPTAPEALKAETVDRGVRLVWKPARDKAGVAAYRVFKSNLPDCAPARRNEIATVTALTFLDTQIMMPGTWWYRVAARDLLDQIGPASAPASVAVQETR